MMAALTNLVKTLSTTVIDDRPELEQLLKDLRAAVRHAGAARRPAAQHLAGPARSPLRGLANATGNGNAVDFNARNGLLVDSWMCAISGRAKQFGMIQYFQDCK